MSDSDGSRDSGRDGAARLDAKHDSAGRRHRPTFVGHQDRVELVAQLRRLNWPLHPDDPRNAPCNPDGPEAADCIEHLEAKCDSMREALEGLLVFAEAAETKMLVGDEGCVWPVEFARAALTQEGQGEQPNG